MPLVDPNYSIGPLVMGDKATLTPKPFIIRLLTEVPEVSMSTYSESQGLHPNT